MTDKNIISEPSLLEPQNPNVPADRRRFMVGTLISIVTGVIGFPFSVLARRVQHLKDLDTLWIHCSGTPNGHGLSVREIDRWHRKRGFSKIGYHWVIHKSGKVSKGRRINEVGSHTKGHNTNSIAVCMVGSDQYTSAQWRALHKMVIDWPHLTVRGHNEVANKTCPGFSVQDWINSGYAVPINHLYVGDPHE